MVSGEILNLSPEIGRVTALPGVVRLFIGKPIHAHHHAQKSPRGILVGFTPIGRASVGPDYNELLKTFVDEHWSVARAVKLAPSLARARRRIAELAAAVSNQKS
jgi:hypothetical protein